MRKKFAILALLLYLSLTAVGRDFYNVYDGNRVIWYTVLDEKAKTVKTKDGRYPTSGNSLIGDIILPEHPKDGSVEYTLVEIGNYAWCGQLGLTSITIPATVTSIGMCAFEDCVALESVTIPNSVTTIGARAFKNTGLITVSIPQSVSLITPLAFADCHFLENFTVDSKNRNYCDVDGVLFNGDKSTLVQYPGGRKDEYTVPNSVKTIGYGAFHGGRAISIAMPNSITTIEEVAFKDCNMLQSINLSTGITSINSSVFENCTALESITLPSSLTSIGSRAFAGCATLNTIAIPQKVRNIASGSSFAGCANLESFTVDYWNDYYCAVDGVIYTKNKSQLVVFPGGKQEHTFHSSATTIGSEAFSGNCKLTSLTIPSHITNLEYGAFMNCTSLNSITIPNSITTIRNYVFSGCSGLTTVNLPSTIKTIENKAFEKCTSLVSITIPSSVTRIDDNVFADCSNLANVRIDGTTPFTVYSNTFPETATLRVPCLYGDTYRKANDGWKYFDSKNKVFEFGDANHSKSLTIADAVATANQMIGADNNSFDAVCADLNFDEDITISDITTVISAINAKPASAKAAVRKAPAFGVGPVLKVDNFVPDSNGKATVNASIEAEGELVALQADFIGNDALAITGVQLSPEVAATHTLSTSRPDDNTLRVTLFSLAGKRLATDGTALMTLSLATVASNNAAPSLEASAVSASSPLAEDIELCFAGGMNIGSASAGGIEANKPHIVAESNSVAIYGAVGRSVAVYDMTGRLVAKFTAETDAAYCPLEKGIYIVAVDNTTTKIIL